MLILHKLSLLFNGGDRRTKIEYGDKWIPNGINLDTMQFQKMTAKNFEI